MEIKDIKVMSDKIRTNIQKVIIGKDEVIDLITTSILCSGHVLLEDIPGTGKTMMAKALAKSIDGSFSRIQFTPDLLPTDLTGLNYFNQKTSEFQFKKGPLMNQIVLADEINRATPRTQSSLLEAMEEHQVTVDGVTYKLEEPFLVIATQNPIEIGGTFPLPEAQLDRFFMQLSMGYPTLNEELQILTRFRKNNPIEELSAVVESSEIIAARQSFTDVYIDEEIAKYILEIVKATRESEDIELGISPRGSLALYMGAQAYAAVKGRNYVLPDDIKRLIKPIFNHRLKVREYALADDTNIGKLLDEIVSKIEPPVENLQAI